jgi:hypothetical protein
MSALEKAIAKMQKNPLGFIRDALATSIADGENLLRVLVCAPYGVTVAQMASLMHIDKSYAQALLNVAVKTGAVEEIGGGGNVVLYKLKTKGE